MRKKKGNAVMTCLLCCSISGTVLQWKKQTQMQCDVSVPCDELKKMSGAEQQCYNMSMAERQKEGKEERRHVQPLHHACQACHNHTQECTVDLQYNGETKHELLGLIGEDDSQQMKPSLSLLNVMSSSLRMILKDKSKEDSSIIQRNSMPSI